MIKKYGQYINEELSFAGEQDFNAVFNLPLGQRIQVNKELNKLANEKSNESSSDDFKFIKKGLSSDFKKLKGSLSRDIDEFTGFFKDIYNRLRQWITDTAISWLINQNERVLREKINTLNMLDPSDFSDIKTVKSMYLGGGIDKTSEEGAAGWRDSVENFFGMDHVVKGEDMVELASTGKLVDSYPKPALLNPMRNELVRTNDPEFSRIFGLWKSGELDKEKNPTDWKYWADIINKEIYAPDLRIVNACDTNLVKLDPAAGAGTLGEMQVSALKNINIFLWLDGGYTVKDISPWTIPSITKLVRNDEEKDILLANIKEKNVELKWFI